MNSVGGRKEYYERIFERHLDEGWDAAPGKEVLLRALATELSAGRLGSSERLIDLGCGTGFLLSRIRSEVCDSFELFGVDFADTAIAKGKELHPSLQLFCEDASATHFDSEYFSILISYGSMEHFPDPAQAAHEVARLLQPQGLFLMMIPTLGVYRVDRDDEGWYEDLTGQPQWNLKRETWEAHFRRNGLRLWDSARAKESGALKPGVFYFGYRS
ncbi:MAG: methyltransferase domain-containing protein [Chloroflexi bacterium]|nr:methyltransferase domain-containing protein [Chloroflexota bacterium]